MSETKVYRLSELYMDYKMIEKLIGSVVVTPDGRELGTIYEMQLNNDHTPRKIAVKGKDATFYVNPKHMFLVGDKVVLQEPTSIDLTHATREALKAVQELLEAISRKNPEEATPNVAIAKQHLRNALKYLAGEDNEKRLREIEELKKRLPEIREKDESLANHLEWVIGVLEVLGYAKPEEHGVKQG